ncbi:MAG TPA: DsbA family protein [Candidatus Limnocylindria bacterium]|nr:DsbA family protein [Candidatus Limnocylindria bacterium]
MTSLAPPVDLQRDHWRGGADRETAWLLAFGDYECPYTRAAYQAIQRLESRMGDDLRLVYRQFPLTDIHPHALSAAGFAEAAAGQGRFWEMHDLLFAHQKALGDEDLLGYADRLGLDRERLRSDLTGDAVWDRVRDDAESAVASGARGTPTIFINGRLHDGSHDEEALEAAVLETRQED